MLMIECSLFELKGRLSYIRYLFTTYAYPYGRHAEMIYLAANEGDDIHGVVRSAIPTTSENGGMSWGSGTTLKRIAGEPEG
jgi:hypothetical protein